MIWGRPRCGGSVWGISREPDSSCWLQHLAADILSLAVWCRKHKEDLVQQAQACSSHRTLNTAFVFLFLCSTAILLCFAEKLDDYKLTCALIINHLCDSIYLTFSMQISTVMLNWQREIEHVNLKELAQENISLWHSILLQHVSQ